MSKLNGLLFIAVAALCISIALSDEVDKRTTTTAKPTTEPTIAEHQKTKTEKTTKHTEPTTEPTTIVTTAASSTTTTPSPPKPLPAEPPRGKWAPHDDQTNVVCIMLYAGIRMTFNYNATNGTMVKNFKIDVPETADARCTCNDQTQVLSLHFFMGWQLDFTFALNSTAHKYDLAETKLSFNVTRDHFPNAQEIPYKDYAEPVNKFSTDDTKSYICTAHQSVFSKNSTEMGVIEINTYSLQFEAFRKSNETVFTSDTNRCEEDKVSQLVPIIVGATLAGLIVIVLIAYLIGRRKSRQGYESV